MQIRLAVAPIAKFVAEVGDDPQVKSDAAMLAAIVAKAGSKDHVTVTAQPIAQGVRVRLEVEEGLLKAIGSMSRMMGGPPGSYDSATCDHDVGVGHACRDVPPRRSADRRRDLAALVRTYTEYPRYVRFPH